MYAARGGHQEVCAWLADRGADPNATDQVILLNDAVSSILDSCSLAYSPAVTVIRVEGQP